MICNVDKLNYFIKRMESFDTNEEKQFYAATVLEKPETMRELINLTFNTHCYNLISDFHDLESVGRQLYFNENLVVLIEELEKLDGKAYVMEAMKQNPNPLVTPYGMVYHNSNEPQKIYNGRQFPEYHYEEEFATVTLTVQEQVTTKKEYLYLPCADIAIEKAVMRLGVQGIEFCAIEIESEPFFRSIEQRLKENIPVSSKISNLNQIAREYKQMTDTDKIHFQNILEYVKPNALNEVMELIQSIPEFQIYDDVTTPVEYGRYMICESGHFEYDENLEDYIDFEGYGKHRFKRENGAFTEKGYITYCGLNHNIQNLLNRNLNISFLEQKELQIVKLYMPLKITTYDMENEYGIYKKTDYPQELDSSEVS